METINIASNELSIFFPEEKQILRFFRASPNYVDCESLEKNKYFEIKEVYGVIYENKKIIVIITQDFITFTIDNIIKNFDHLEKMMNCYDPKFQLIKKNNETTVEFSNKIISVDTGTEILNFLNDDELGLFVKKLRAQRVK
jgi:hypothetical protein